MATASGKKVDPSAIAAKFRTLADGMQQTIDERRRPLTQNATPKRLKEYMSRKLEGDNLERGQRALRALANAWLRGDVPEILRGLRIKTEIVPLVRHGLNSSGYYDVHSTGMYADQGEMGKSLQSLMENSKSDEDKEADAERERLARIERLENALHGCDIPGFFPTPRPLIVEMAKYADLKPGLRVLEPSAGKGDIADFLRAEFPTLGLRIACCEIRSTLREILEAKGHELVGSDFLEHTANYDRIISNPPFENLQDADHVRHAYNRLNEGGRLVSIMSTAPFYRSDRKAREFREWFSVVGGEEWDAPLDSFKGVQAFRQTGVRCKVVVITKT